MIDPKNLKLAIVVAVLSSATCISGTAQAAELLANGGFEDGTYTSTIDGNTNAGVPNDWTPNAAFDLESGFNQVNNNAPHSGTFELSIGNYDDQPLAALSQTVTDVSGDTYTASFYYYATDSGDVDASLSALINGTTEFTAADSINSYTEESFTFTGTGSDVFTIEAQTNPGEWYVDDVSITGVVSSVPEPATWAMFLIGFGGIGFMMRRSHGNGTVARA